VYFEVSALTESLEWQNNQHKVEGSRKLSSFSVWLVLSGHKKIKAFFLFLRSGFGKAQFSGIKQQSKKTHFPKLTLQEQASHFFPPLEMSTQSLQFNYPS